MAPGVPPSLECFMAISKPRAAASVTPPTSPATASALRTLEAEASGVSALVAALEGDLGAPFTAAVDLIHNAKGRLIVTGLGKSGHIGKKIAASFASTGTPSFFVHAAEASHGDLGMITADDVIMALSWSGETAELKNTDHLFAPFPHRPDRHYIRSDIDLGRRRRHRADAAASRAKPARTISPRARRR